MKYRFILAALFILSACDDKGSCQWESSWRVNQALRSELFDKCLVLVAEARGGESYTTTFSEDYQKVVSECGEQAYSMSRYCIYDKSTKE